MPEKRYMPNTLCCAVPLYLYMPVFFMLKLLQILYAFPKALGCVLAIVVLCWSDFSIALPVVLTAILERLGYVTHKFHMSHSTSRSGSEPLLAQNLTRCVYSDFISQTLLTHVWQTSGDPRTMTSVVSKTFVWPCCSSSEAVKFIMRPVKFVLPFSVKFILLSWRLHYPQWRLLTCKTFSQQAFHRCPPSTSASASCASEKRF